MNTTIQVTKAEIDGCKAQLMAQIADAIRNPLAHPLDAVAKLTASLDALGSFQAAE